MKYGISSYASNILKMFSIPSNAKVQDLPFDDNFMHIITKTDLEGYEGSLVMKGSRKALWTDLSVLYSVKIMSQAAMAGVSCLWLRYRSPQISSNDSREYQCSIQADQLGSLSVDIHVY